MSTSDRDARRLAALLGGAGVTHFVAPRPYDAIVPRWVPGSPRFWTRASGVAEIAVATSLLNPRTRRVGGLAAAALFAAVFPANVQMAWDWRHRPLPARLAAYGRLPLQLPLITTALRVGRAPRAAAPAAPERRAAPPDRPASSPPAAR